MKLDFYRTDKVHKVLSNTWGVTSNQFKLLSNESKDLNLDIELDVETIGSYYGNLKIISNDPVYPIKTIPFKLKIA